MTVRWLMAAVVMAGCAKADDSAAPMEPLQTETTPTIDVQWSPCYDTLKCATIDVPLDHADPSLGTTPLRIVRDPVPPAQKEGVIFVNPGGPGGAPVDMVYYTGLIVGDWGERYDIVGIDPRGAGANPFACHQDLHIAFGVDYAPTTMEGIEALQEARVQWAEGCLASDAELIKYSTMPDMADDYAFVATQLGAETFGFFGISAGSIIGALIAEQHPDRVWRMAIDSSLPTASYNQSAQGSSDGMATAFADWDVDCVGRDACPLGENRLDLVDELLTGLKDQPIPVRARELTSSMAMTGMVYALGHEQGWDDAASAVQAALNGDGAPLLDLADQSFLRSDTSFYDGGQTAFAVEACSFGTEERTHEQMLADALDANDFFPHFGALYALEPGICEGLPASRRPHTGAVSGRGAGPILMLHSSLDPITPMRGAVEVNDALEDSAMVIWEGVNHGTAFSSDCAMQHLVDYFETGVLPADGTVCAD